ncbi:hypothetical protein J3Q64DRAFT_1765625 [Phycomyces blakesleeanus]|uniref:Transcription initiation factor TFIID subunit 8 n=2 Tax=Phycomyces blakesleeanus TaxID=4837 RepID=A0A163AN76_PHYB8|nr:hypothetical protein PHYBLDRAFT_144017 [Phycomyces blakesleeanus NRRL 1555(-)]OAD74641.1 hypothetical protein PHYBLDRAFT_144017 [Phycomyces blakesleeanus NRRL 1555(-)]|eukprot:XP_018292681.1 hypothetical protein PHYBLDRAFT_144017 [Phycomyces blakesleeanus NRRL 1555(-)]
MKTVDTKGRNDTKEISQTKNNSHNNSYNFYNNNNNKNSTEDITEAAFVNAANSKVVSLLAKEAGFNSVQRSALDSLSDILGIYLERILYSSHTYAELGNRMRPNYHDVEQSLKDEGLPMQNFEKYLEKTKADKTLVKPAKRVLRIERSKSQNMDQTSHFLPSEDEDEDEFSDERRESSGQDLPSYVPSHLPRFPSKHSFRQTPVYIQRPDDPQKVRALNSQQSRTVEENLKRLMSAENQHGLHTDDRKDSIASGSTVAMPLVNYENSMQRRARAKQSGFSDFRASGRNSYSGDKPVIPLKRFSDTLDSPPKDARKNVGPVN